MRLAVISDIHGNLAALEIALKDLESVGEVDLIWCLGDIALGGTRPAACVAKLRELKEEYGKDKFKVIGGNTDRYVVTNKRPNVPPANDEEAFEKLKVQHQQMDDVINWTRAQLSWEDYEFLAKTLGRELRTDVEGYGTIIGYHAIPGDDEPTSLKPDTPEEEALDALLDRAGRLAIGGHTHEIMDRTLGAWRAINPGSVGLSFTNINQVEWALVTIENGEAEVDFRQIEYDFQTMLDEIESVSYPHAAWLTRFVK